MHLSHITVHGFKSFAKKTTLDVTHQVTGVVGPNGSGKSNIAEAIRFVLGEQSMKSMRSKSGSDVIFKGSEHLPPMSRATVTMVIDNKDKSRITTSHISEDLASYLVYDELTLSRTIYADGGSEYTLNDAKVRLKDVQELLSFAGIGGSAHTIINQGEADKILLANPRERKEALEDALGLRVFHLRLNESARKLEKVKAHVREIELLRNEIKPHLAHLERQVKKIESQEEERQKLNRLLVVYLKKEERELERRKGEMYERGTATSLHLVQDTIEKELEFLKSLKREDTALSVNVEKERLHAEKSLSEEKLREVTKTLGRLEGEKSYLERELGREVEATNVTIEEKELRGSQILMDNGLTSIARCIVTGEYDKAVEATETLKEESSQFFEKYLYDDKKRKQELENDILGVTSQITEHEKTVLSLAGSIRMLSEQLERLSSSVSEGLISRHEEEKKKVLLESKLRELGSEIRLREQEERELGDRTLRWKALLEEGVVIIGRVLLEYRETSDDPSVVAMNDHDLMRAIERSKLRIEEASVPNKEEILTEYTTTKEREEYLSKELTDIRETEGKLLHLIEELTLTLSERFAHGVEEVSKIFSTFFGEVYPGGKAKLSRMTIKKIDEDANETLEEGIDLDVSLPNKKVKELAMFSGGERALVSIALLFAMSQVTPPPFMVLDETDAPLDESNARKYGAMMRRLAEKSKLLVITHNRETMNHCDMLYGVTLGVEGGSKLLSINLKDADGYAK
ncbi:MAG: AAA family ATPase [Candidatus Pacebacteria bacterium]|nr:AAA family ATPase [Candidatus Paceibacterota bacterium]